MLSTARIGCRLVRPQLHRVKTIAPIYPFHRFCYFPPPENKWIGRSCWHTYRVRFDEFRLKIEYLVAENRILQSQFEGRLRLTDKQRITLASIGKRLGPAALGQVASIVTPETILAWHRKLVAAKFDTSNRPKCKPWGQPPLDAVIIRQIVRMAQENPTWGYRRIAGALATIQIAVSHQTIKHVLEAHGIDPAPQRKEKTSWSDFVKSHTDCLLATDFLTTGKGRAKRPRGGGLRGAENAHTG